MPFGFEGITGVPHQDCICKSAFSLQIGVPQIMRPCLYVLARTWFFLGLVGADPHSEKLPFGCGSRSSAFVIGNTLTKRSQAKVFFVILLLIMI